MNSRELAGRLSPCDIERIAASSLWSGADSLSWPDALRDLPSLAAAWRRMPRQAAIALKAVLLRFGALPFKEEQLLDCIEPGEAGADYRIGLILLSRSGILFGVRKSWGEKLYFLPRDSYFPWFRTIMPVIELPARDMWDLTDIRYEEQGGSYVPPFGIQLLHMLAELTRTGGGKTAKGTLTKRAIDKCGAQLVIGPADFGGMELKGKLADAYPLPLAVALDTALRHGWLHDESNALRLDETAWHGWLALPAAVREAGMLAFVMEHYALRSSELALAAACASALQQDRWYLFSDLDARYSALLPDYKRERSGLEQWIRLMQACGWLEIADSAAKGRYIRWQVSPTSGHDYGVGQDEPPAGSGAEPIHISPDGDIFVHAHASGLTRWILEKYGLRVRAEWISLYRLDGRSLERAERNGLSLEELKELLEADSGCSLPQLVADMISERPETRRDDKQLAASDEPVPANGSAMVDFPGKSALRGGHAASSAVSAEPTGCQRGFDDPSDLQRLELLTETPDPDALFAGMEEIPSMWMKQFRAYHMSTRKELLERALEWRIPVKLNIDGSSLTFVPAELANEGANWAVIGYERSEERRLRIRLEPDSWHEMMLVVPKKEDYE